MSAKLSRRVIARTVAAKLLAEPSKRRDWLRATAAYLVEHHMADNLDLIVNDIAHELFIQSGKLHTEVTSARPLTDAIRHELRRMLQEATGASQVTLSERVNPELLGGLVARTPDAQLDVSVRSTLRQLATINKV